ncbi:MAG TPA: hypothetical protein VFS42_05370, partial [Burkholderiaceae bacterium]|nr:hypothetical protein [Burkholderiaceae bacterium]
AQGMSLLMNGANIVTRRAIKALDDGITTPFITAMYSWNMLYNPDESVKGDYNVQAKGSAALMEREQQAQMFFQFLQFVNSNPILAKGAKWDKIAEEGARLLRMNKAGLFATPEEFKQIIDEMAKQPPPVAPQIEVAKIRAEVDKYVADLNAQLEKGRQALDKVLADAKLASDLQMHLSQQGMSLEELKQSFGLARMQEDNANARFNAEMAAKMGLGSGI